MLTNEQRLRMLEVPGGHVDMVLDTDAYNEIDDQFAISYAMKADKLSVKAIYAAPFYNSRSSGPADGMEKSYGIFRRDMELFLRVPFFCV